MWNWSENEARINMNADAEYCALDSFLAQLIIPRTLMRISVPIQIANLFCILRANC
jgi:hypothetical protein